MRPGFEQIPAGGGTVGSLTILIQPDLGPRRADFHGKERPEPQDLVVSKFDRPPELPSWGRSGYDS